MSLKTRLFVNERNMYNKPIIDVPGVGEAMARIFREKQITMAEHLYKKWIKLHKDKARFENWLECTCGISYTCISAALIVGAFENWHHKYGRGRAPDRDVNNSDRRQTRHDTSGASTSFAQTNGNETETANPDPVETDTKETILSVELDVSIMGEGDVPLNDVQTTAINQYLEESILTSIKENTCAPKFKEMSITDGALQLSCEDALSLEWLQRTIANAPEVEGAKITLKRKSELSKRFKVALFMPDCNNSVHDTVLLLTKQNKWAQIETWKKHSEIVKDSVLFLEFWIPETVIPLLLEKGGQLSHKFGTVETFRRSLRSTSSRSERRQERRTLLRDVFSVTDDRLEHKFHLDHSQTARKQYIQHATPAVKALDFTYLLFVKH